MLSMLAAQTMQHHLSDDLSHMHGNISVTGSSLLVTSSSLFSHRQCSWQRLCSTTYRCSNMNATNVQHVQHIRPDCLIHARHLHHISSMVCARASACASAFVRVRVHTHTCVCARSRLWQRPYRASAGQQHLLVIGHQHFSDSYCRWATY